MIEYFIHIDSDRPPKDLVVATAEVPDNLSRTLISPKQLPVNWRQSPPPPELTEIGDRFVREGRVAILIVPSALAPAESNWLINPGHPEFSRIRVGAVERFEYDQRFFNQPASSRQ
jgi:RES domain-containing protein